MTGPTTRADSGTSVLSGEPPTLAPTLVVAHAGSGPAGTRLRLEDGEAVELGRDSPVLGGGSDDKLSRRHVRFVWRMGRLELADLGSTNGTWVNGARVSTVELGTGDVVVLGRSIFVVAWEPPSAVAVDADGWVGTSYRLARTLAELRSAAPGAVPVLILGETGTGKELAAREVHRASGRRGPWLAVNCAAMDENLLQSELFGHVRGAFSGGDRDRPGLVEAAHGGTLFLDEIGDAPPRLQASLLRVLQEGEVRRVGSNTPVRVDTRFVAATHRDLTRLVAEGTFREDLYARLARIVVRVPPLRERREDVLQLAAHVARRTLGRPAQLHRGLAAALLQHDWPRNVREVEAVVERLALGQRGADLLRLPPEGLPGPARATDPPARARAGRPADAELVEGLRRAGGNVSAYAAELGVSRLTVYRWLKRAGIPVDEARS